MKVVNPKGPSKGKCRILHGSSWSYDDRYLTTIRYYFSSAYKSYNIGFRIVCNVRKG